MQNSSSLKWMFSHHDWTTESSNLWKPKLFFVCGYSSDNLWTTFTFTHITSSVCWSDNPVWFVPAYYVRYLTSTLHPLFRQVCCLLHRNMWKAGTDPTDANILPLYATITSWYTKEKLGIFSVTDSSLASIPSSASHKSTTSYDNARNEVMCSADKLREQKDTEPWSRI